MGAYVRLRQICLVAPQLEPVISDIADIMGLSVCYRDGNVAKYGLVNALLPVDTILLEVVAPVRKAEQEPLSLHHPRSRQRRCYKRCSVRGCLPPGPWPGPRGRPFRTMDR